ncbi:MAG: GNAT family N-acetyltransferase [Deltaproteobacteria bacterium]|nr:GNAT family N-acetyltransferase [Deltaproteobacteria bacterium]
MDDPSLLQRADLNFVEFNREGARWAAGGIVHEEDGLVFFVPGHRFPVGFTGVMRSDPALPARAMIDRAGVFFGPRGHGYTFCLMAHRDADVAAALEEGGISVFGNSPGMALDAPLPEAALPADVTIQRVTDAAGAAAFAAVSGAAYATYGMPARIVLAHFADHRFFTQPHVAAFVARVDGEAAAAAMVMVTHGVAGVYWVGTTPQARGRGLAEACTRVAGNAGFDMGAKVAALQASVMGEPIYRRMGYREITRYPWYVVMP